MTLNSIQDDLIFLSAFLLAGFAVREVVKPLQRWFLPASIVGGVLALVMGQQVLGWVQVPKSFPGFAGTLTVYLMAGLVFGVKVSAKKFRSFADYFCICVGLYGMQIMVGTLLGMFLSLFWTELPLGWGVLGHTAFHAGHGTAAVAGAAFEEVGVAGSLDIAMIFATIGLLSAMIVGMILVNYGVRKGWASFVTEVKERPMHFYGGALPMDERKSIGDMTTPSLAVNNLMFQVAFVLASIGVGQLIFKHIVGPFFPGVKFAAIIYGVVGAAVFYAVLAACKLDKFVDKKTINTTTGFVLEIIILASIATLRLDIISKFIVPIAIYSAVIVLLTIVITYIFARRCCQDEWFEKACMLYGMATGTTATGLALVRTIDPDSKSTAPEAHGVYAAIALWPNIFPVIFPTIALTSLWPIVGIGALFFVIPLVIAVMFFRRREAA